MFGGLLNVEVLFISQSLFFFFFFFFGFLRKSLLQKIFFVTTKIRMFTYAGDNDEF